MLSILKILASQAIDFESYNQKQNAKLDEKLKTCEFRPEDFQKKKKKTRNKSFLTKK